LPSKAAITSGSLDPSAPEISVKVLKRPAAASASPFQRVTSVESVSTVAAFSVSFWTSPRSVVISAVRVFFSLTTVWKRS